MPKLNLSRFIGENGDDTNVQQRNFGSSNIAPVNFETLRDEREKTSKIDEEGKQAGKAKGRFWSTMKMDFRQSSTRQYNEQADLMLGALEEPLREFKTCSEEKDAQEIGTESLDHIAMKGLTEDLEHLRPSKDIKIQRSKSYTSKRAKKSQLLENVILSPISDGSASNRVGKLPQEIRSGGDGRPRNSHNEDKELRMTRSLVASEVQQEKDAGGIPKAEDADGAQAPSWKGK